MGLVDISYCIAGGHSRITLLLGFEHQHSYCHTISIGGWSVSGLCCARCTCLYESHWQSKRLSAHFFNTIPKFLNLIACMYIYNPKTVANNVMLFLFYYCRKGMYYIIRNWTASVEWWNIYCACICVVNMV